MENGAKRLIELFNDRKDIIIDDMPDGWREDFEKHLLCQTIYKNEDDKFCAYHEDYRYWFYKNKLSIEREAKIDQIC